MNIKPIETRFKGHRFRSRLEARWAVFFDTLGLSWEYEKEGFVLKAGPYLPDFWLPDLELWLEVKGLPPTQDELNKAEQLSGGSASAAIFHGLPGEHVGICYCGDLTDSSGGESEWEVAWGDGVRATAFGGVLHPMLVCCDDTRKDRTFCHRSSFAHFPGLCRADEGDRKSLLVSAAARAARSARFEHGEEGPG